MNLEEIMQPYLDKKQELEDRKTFLTLRLERLRNNKEKEINKFVESAILEKPDFFNGYGAMIRKDLEQEYLTKEKTLELELKNIEKYSRVDIRELVEIKTGLRKDLISAKNKLELELREVQLEFDNVNLKFSRFKHEYDENHIPTNGEEYKRLFNRSHELVEIKYNLQRKLKEIEEYLNTTNLTPEEANIMMMTLTPWEQEEYDRRKDINVSSIKQEKIIVENNNNVAEESEIVEENSLEQSTIESVVEQEKKVETQSNEEKLEEATTQSLQESKVEYIGDEIIADSFKSLLETVYVDIIDSAKKLRVVKKGDENTKFITMSNVDELSELDAEVAQLPNGTYLNKQDLSKALDNYRKKIKGTTFKVKGIDATLEINKKTIKQVKKLLNDCTVHKLMSEKKLGFFDIKRVYGKEKAEEYSKESEIGNKFDGNYIELNQFGNTLKNLFAKKSTSWFNRFKEYNKKMQETLDSKVVEAIEQKQNVKTK